MILLGFVNVMSGYPVHDVLYICNLRLVKWWHKTSNGDEKIEWSGG